MKVHFQIITLFQMLFAFGLTAQPASLLIDLTPGSGSTQFQDLERVSNGSTLDHFPSMAIFGTYYFSANANGATGGYLYETKGTAASTKVISSNATFGPYNDLVRVNDRPAFFGQNGNVAGIQRNLFNHDGSKTNNLETVANCTSQAPAGFDRFNPMGWAGKAWYRKLKCGGGADIWYDEGFQDVQVTNTTSYPHLLGTYGTNMFIVMGGSASHPGGSQLWKAGSFSTQPATLVKNVNFNNPNMDYLPSVNAGGDNGLFFIAESALGGQAIWKTDGTAAGTREVAAAFGYHNILSLSGGEVCFVGKGIGGRPTLYRTKGTLTTTKLIAEIALPDFIETFEMALIGNSGTGKVVMSNKSGIYGNELYVCDLKTRKVSLVENIHTQFQGGNPDGSSNPANFTKIGKYIYFTADNGFQGRELWRTDGTTENTGLVADIWQGGLSSDPKGLVRLNNSTLLFTANDGIHGRELWKLDINAIDDANASDDRTDETSELAIATELEVAPNPTSDRLQIFTTAENIASMRLLDLNGRIVRDIQITDAVTVENIANLSAGIYVLQASTTDGQILTKKVVKN